MKKTIFKTRALAFLMAIVLVSASFMLIGCDKGNKGPVDTDSETPVDSTAPNVTEGTTSDTDAKTTDTEAPESTDTEVPPVPTINVFADGKLLGDIVIADKPSDVITRAANELKDAITSELKVTPDLRKESTFKTLNGGTLDVSKIVVGSLKGDAYCETLVSELADNDDHVIAAKDGTLYIIGKTDATTAVAVNKFISFYVHSNKTEIVFNEGKIEDDTTDYEGIKINGTPVVDFSIVTYDSYYARALAESIQAQIKNKIGLTLPVVVSDTAERTHEILVGKTDRAATKAIRAEYDRPNVYYDIKAVDTKLVVLGEGYQTLEKLGDLIEAYAANASANVNIEGEVVSGDILADVDAVDCMTDALEKAASVDMRVLHWNMAAPLSWDQSGEKWGANWPFTADVTGRKMRAEQQADMVLIYNPDIITTNEIYEYHAGGVQINTFKKEISDYFVEIDSTYDARDEDKPLAVPETAPGSAENPEKIFIRKGMFTVKDSGWRYLSDGTTFHGIHWAILETTEGKQFIISGAHYSDTRTEVTYASEHQSAIRFAQQCSGSSTVLPTILTGDMFTYINHSASSSGAGYYYHESKGYNDAQTKAAINCNDDKGVKHGTFHDPMNDSNKGRASEDFVWYNKQLVASKFGVITIPQSTNTSDHWPVFADLSFAS